MLKYLIIFFISMVPIVELRGAIPFATAMGQLLLGNYNLKQRFISMIWMVRLTTYVFGAKVTTQEVV